MHNEFTALIERDGDWYVAYCPEIPGANGQGRGAARRAARHRHNRVKRSALLRQIGRAHV